MYAFYGLSLINLVFHLVPVKRKKGDIVRTPIALNSYIV